MKSVISTNDCYCINKSLSMEIGLIPTLVLSILINSYNELPEKKVIDGKWFSKRRKEMLKELPELSKATLSRILDKLIMLNFIERGILGYPGTVHYKFNMKTIKKYYSVNSYNPLRTQIESSQTKQTLENTQNQRSINKKDLNNMYIYYSLYSNNND